MIGKYFPVMLTIGLLNVFYLNAQKPVLITESTLKLGPFKEEIFYYGFAAGDKLVFNFKETNDKDLKEIEITELPSSVKFLESRISKIENKTINIVNTGIYKFRITNGVLPKTCKYEIQRIPASESTQNFNTTIYTRTVDDSVFVTEKENYIDKTDTVITNLQDRSVKLPAVSASGANKANFNFLLAENTIAWSYYISIDDAGKKIYDDAAKIIAGNATKYQKYGPLGAEVYGENSHLNKIESGKQVNYWIVEGENADLFMNGAQFKFIKKGTIVNDFAKMSYRKGSLYFCFSNGSATDAVNITVKITSLHINEVTKTRSVRQLVSVKPKTEMYLKN